MRVINIDVSILILVEEHIRKKSLIYIFGELLVKLILLIFTLRSTAKLLTYEGGEINVEL